MKRWCSSRNSALYEGAAEFEARLAVFVENTAAIAALNDDPEDGATYAMNAFGDLSADEFRAQRLMGEGRAPPDLAAAPRLAVPAGDAPDAVKEVLLKRQQTVSQVDVSALIANPGKVQGALTPRRFEMSKILAEELLRMFIRKKREDWDAKGGRPARSAPSGGPPKKLGTPPPAEGAARTAGEPGRTEGEATREGAREETAEARGDGCGRREGAREGARRSRAAEGEGQRELRSELRSECAAELTADGGGGPGRSAALARCAASGLAGDGGLRDGEGAGEGTRRPKAMVKPCC